MGGIAGIVNLDGTRPGWRQGMDMASAVGWRGRDDQGFFLEGPALLVQCRNAVLSEGTRQPIVSERYVLAFDGGHYGHLDLARRLPPQDMPLESLGDAEVLLKAWETWGPECLQHIDGAYAFALWDRKERALWLVRAPVGFRTLYYSVSGKKVAVASTPAGLVALPWVSREVSPGSLCEYLAFRYVHAPRTLLKDVQALPAGTILHISEEGSRIRSFGQAPFCPRDTPVPSREDALPELEHHLREAVFRRCPSGQPSTLLLSGGLDSTVLAHLAASSGRPTHTWHLVFPGSGVDEAAFAGRVANLLGTHHRDRYVEDDDFISALPAAVEAMGVPIPDPAAVTQLLLFQSLRTDSRVALCGVGGDEVFAGGRTVDAAVAWTGWRGSVRERLARVAARSGVPPWLQQPLGPGIRVGGTEVLDARARARLLVPAIDPDPDLRARVLEPLHEGSETDPVNEVLRIYQRGWLAEDTVACLDRMALAAGVEARFPLLDRGVVTFANQQPGSWKLGRRLGSTRPKLPLRELVPDRVPRRFLDRPKVSFPSPLHQWLRGPGACFLTRMLDRMLSSRWGLWRPDPVRELVRAHQMRRGDHGGALWVLIFLDLWLDHLHGVPGSSGD